MAQGDKLVNRKCVPCEGGIDRLGSKQVRLHLAELGGGWQVADGHRLEREWTFADFRAAIDFANQVAELAEAEGHHPEILLGWGHAKVFLWTHAVDGLTENDFILAAKISALPGRG